MAGLPKVSSYLKNVGRSITYSTIDYMKDNGSATAEFLDTNRELFRDIYSATINYRTTIKKIDKTIKRSKIYEAGKLGLQNIKEDLKTGNFYNKDREERMGLEAMGFDFSGFDEDFSNEVEDGSETTAKTSTEILEDAVATAAHAQAKSFTSNISYLTETTKANTKLQIMSTERLIGAVNTGFGGMNNVLTSINEIIHGPLMAHMDNSTKYYDTTTKLLQEQNAMMKELLEMNRNLYNANKNEAPSSSDWDAVLGSRGTPNLKEYGKHIKKNFNEQMSSLGLDMLFGNSMGDGTNMLKAFVGSPLKFLTNGLVRAIVPNIVKESINSLDEGIGTLFTNFMNKLELTRRKDPFSISGMLASILGFKPNFEKKSLDTSKVVKEPVPFDNDTKVAIIETIPTYLRRIEAALTGKEERIYDQKRGEWTTVNKLKREYDEKRLQRVASSTYDLRSELERNVFSHIEAKNSKEFADTMRAIFNEKMAPELYREGHINLSQNKEDARKQYGYFSEDKAKDRIFKDFFDFLWGTMSSDTMENRKMMKAIRELSGNINSQKNYFNKEMSGAEGDVGNALRQLFNQSHFEVNKPSGRFDGVDEATIVVIPSGGSTAKGKKGKKQRRRGRQTVDENGIPVRGNPAEDRLDGYNYHGIGAAYERQQEMKRQEHERRMEEEPLYKLLVQNDIDPNSGDVIGQAAEKGLFGGAVLAMFRVQKMLQMPSEKLAGMLDKADKKLFNFVFGKNEKYEIYDKEGKRVEGGFLDYTLYRMNNLFDQAGDKMNEVFDNLKNKFEESELGQFFKKQKDKVINDFMDGFGEKFIQMTKDKFKDVWNNGKRSFSDIRNELGQQMAISNVRAQFNNDNPMPPELEELFRLNPQKFKEFFGTRGDKASDMQKSGELAAMFDIINQRMAETGGSKKAAARWFFKQAIPSQDKEKTDQPPTAATGGYVSKGGLTFVSPGELIIPSSFDSKTLDRQEKKERSLRDKLFGSRSDIPLNANGNVNIWGQAGQSAREGRVARDIFKFGKDYLKDKYDEKYADIHDGMAKVKEALPDIASNGVVGGALGLILGGPLLGAALGAGKGIIDHSETAQKFLFGEEVMGKDGKKERKGGLIPKKVMDTVSKYAPDFKKYGIAGAVASLITPLGPLGGMLVGAGITALKNNENFNKYVFGDEENEGLITKEFQETIKKGFPSLVKGAGIGAIAGFLGPFGILGGAAMGAGLGLFSTTSTFADLLLGKEDSQGNRDGGLVRALNDSVIKPISDTIKKNVDSFQEFFQKNIIDNLKQFASPFAQMIKNAIGNIADYFKEKAANAFEKFMGGPVVLAFRKILDPIGKVANGILKGGIGAAKGLVSAPFKMLGGIGKNIESTQLMKGTASRSTAAQRLRRRDALQKGSLGKKIKFGIGNDRAFKLDEFIASSNENQIIDLYDALSVNSKEQNKINKEYRDKMQKANADAFALYDQMGLRNDEKGRKWFEQMEKVARDAANGDTKAAAKLEKLLDKKNMDLTDEQKDQFRNLYNFDELRRYNKRTRYANIENKEEKDVLLRSIPGFENLKDKDIKRLTKYLGYEVDDIKKVQAERDKGKNAQLTPEQEMAEAYRKEQEATRTHITAQVDLIIEALQGGNKLLTNISNNTDLDPDQLRAEANAEKDPVINRDASTDPVIGDEGPTGQRDKVDKKKWWQFWKKGRSTDPIRGAEDPTGQRTKRPTIFDEFFNQEIDSDGKINKKFIGARGIYDKLFLLQQDTLERSVGRKFNKDLIKKYFGKKSTAPIIGSNVGPYDDGEAGISKEEADSKREETKKKSWFKNVLDKITESAESNKTLTGFFTGKKEPKKGLGGIFKGIGGMLGGFFGLGGGLLKKIGLAAVGLSLTGYLSEFWTDKVWPGIKSFLFGEKNENGETTKTGLLSGFSNLLLGENGFLTKFCGFIGDTVKGIKDWYTSEGGLTGILLNKVAPFLIKGWGFAADNIIAPITAMLIKALPSIAVGLVKGLVKGLKMAIWNDTLSRNNITVDDGGVADKIVSMSDSRQSALAASMGDLGSSIKGVFGTASSSVSSVGKSAAEINFSDLFTREDKNNEQKGFFDKLTGRTQRTNEVEIDENGNVITQYTRNNKTDSLASKTLDMAKNAFAASVAGLGGGGLTKLLTNIKPGSHLGKAVSKLGIITGGVTAGLRGVGETANLGSKLGEIVNAANKTSLADGSGTLYNIANKGLEKLGQMSTKGGIIGKIGDAGLSLADKAYHAGAAVTEAAGNSKIVSGILKIFEGLFGKLGGTIIKYAKMATGKELTEKIVKNTFDKMANALAKNALTKAPASALKSIGSAISNFSPLALAFMVTDFLSGFNNADTLLGVAKGDSYDIGFGQKVLCGFVNLINQRITLGFVPTSTIMNILVDYIAPLFNIDTQELKAAQSRAASELDAWNLAAQDPNSDHYGETYDNLQDFNNKDKWTTKLKKAIGGSNIVQGAKNLGSKVVEGAKGLGGKLVESAKNLGSGLSDGLSNLWKSVSSIGSFTAESVKDAIHYAKTGEHLDTVKIDKDDPMAGIKNVVKTGTRVAMFVPAVAVKLFGGIYDKIKPVITGIQDLHKNQTEFAKNILKNAWNGDIIGAFQAESGQNSEYEFINNTSKVLSTITKITHSPIILLGGIIGNIKNAIGPVVTGVKDLASNQADFAKNLIKEAWNGNIVGAFQAEPGQNSEYGFINTTSKVLATITKIMNAPIILLGGVVGSIKNGIISFVDGTKTVFDTVKTGVGTIMSNAWNGSDEEYTVESTGNELLDNISNGVINVANIIATPVKLLSGAVTGIKNTVSDWISMYTQSKENAAVANKDAVATALSGEGNIFSKDYWKLPDQTGNGIFGVLDNINTFINKLLLAPVTILSNIGHTVSDAFNSVKDWFGEKFGGIWSWIKGFFNDDDKDDVTSELEEEANSGKGRKGFGRVIQQDYANMRYGRSTIGKAGCGPVAAANLLNGYGNDVPSMARYAERHGFTAPDGGTDINYFNSVLSSRGIPNKQTGDKNEIKNTLKRGGKAVLLGAEPGSGYESAFGSGPHFVTATGMDRNGNITIDDPEIRGQRKFPANKVLKNTIRSVVTKGKGRKGFGRYFGKAFVANMAVNDGGGGSSTQTTLSDKNLGPDAVLNVARSQIGTMESPANSNKQKYGAAAGNNGQAWCCYFVWWCFNQAGAADLFYGGNVCGSCSTLRDYHWGRSQRTYDPQPGDIVLFSFDRTCQHVGIVESVNADGSIVSIEGNTSGSGSQDNGGMVLRKNRKKSSIHGYIRPKYPYDYNASKVIDMSKYGDTNDYKTIALTGGQMDPNLLTYDQSTTYLSSSTGSNGSTSDSSTTGTLFSALKDLGVAYIKKIFGPEAYEALFGTSSDGSVGTGALSDDQGQCTQGDSYNTTDPSTIKGNTNAQKIMDYLLKKGYTKAGAAGLMGNLQQESGMQPNNLQNSYNKKLGMTDEAYTAALNNRTRSKAQFTAKNAADGGYGLAQWTYWNRKQGLYENTIEKGKNIDDLIAQMDYLDHELRSSYKSVFQKLITTNSVNDASDTVLTDFEGPAVKDFQNRRNYSNTVYNEFKDYKVNQDETLDNKNYLGMGRHDIDPIATRAMNRNNQSMGYYGYANDSVTPISMPHTPAITKQAATAGVNVSMDSFIKLLSSIVDILVTISDNTGALNSILDVLSENLGVKLSSEDVTNITSSNSSKIKAKQALNDLIAKSMVGKGDVNQRLEDGDTQYIIDIMSSIAKE